MLPGLKHVELQGEGEPLLHEHFFDMAHYLRQKNPGVKLSFITNGSLFTTKNIDGILDSKFNQVVISVESVNALQFQEIRGGKFDRVIRGIENLLTARRERGLLLPRIGFAVTVLKSTRHQLKAIVNLYNQLGMDGGIVYQALQTMSSYTQFYDATMMDERINRSDWQQFNSIIASDFQIQKAVSHSEYNFYRELINNTSQPQTTCAWLENGLYVSASGEAVSCCFIKDYDSQGFGKLKDTTLIDLKEKRVDLLKQLKNGENPAQCRGCGIAARINHSRSGKF